MKTLHDCKFCTCKTEYEHRFGRLGEEGEQIYTDWKATDILPPDMKNRLDTDTGAKVVTITSGDGSSSHWRRVI